MPRVLVSVCAVLIAVTMTTSPARAWGPVGHRLVAHLATDELDPSAKREVARLLRGEPDPSLAGVANWADDLREQDADLGRRTSRWHYVNLAEDDCRYVAAMHCSNGDCVIEAIRRQKALLADRKQPDAVRAQALKFLVHLVGDAHQPLHAGYARDRGGNTVQLQLDGKGTNLHRLWDSDVTGSAKLGEKRYLRRLRSISLPAAARIDANDPAAWAEAACAIVLEPGFYPDRTKVEPAYFSRWRPTADTQLRIAGHRLARILNDTLRVSDASARRPGE